MLRQIWESMLHLTLHVLVLTEIQKSQSSDWPNDVVRYDLKHSHILLNQMSYRGSEKWVGDTSMVM